MSSKLDSVAPVSHRNQISANWTKAASICQLSIEEVQEIRMALREGGSSLQPQSRLTYLLKAEGVFSEPSGIKQTAALIFLNLEYNRNRASSPVANDKWQLSRTKLLELSKKLPVTVAKAPFFAELEKASVTRPRKSHYEERWFSATR